MNFSTVAMLLLAWQLLRTSNTPPQKAHLEDFLSQEAKDVLGCVGKLSHGSNDDKMGAVVQLLSNPTVAGILQNVLGNTQSAPQKEQTFENEEGYRFEQPSQASKEFFRPIDNIADAEVKHKLYWFYDNWYVK